MSFTWQTQIPQQEWNSTKISVQGTIILWNIGPLDQVFQDQDSPDNDHNNVVIIQSQYTTPMGKSTDYSCNRTLSYSVVLQYSCYSLGQILYYYQ